MLTPADDFPIHQTPEPVANPATSDRNAYDRYWFNGYDRDGAFYFAFAHGLYPNRFVADAHFTVTVDGVQHSLHASRRASLDRFDLGVGPLRVEVVEPLKVLRLIGEANDTGIAFDLTFTARAAVIEEPRVTTRNGHHVIMDATRLTQLGAWSGTITVPGGRVIEVDAATTPGTRDRSWGIRPVGERDAGAPKPFNPLMWLWAPLHWDDEVTLWGSFERADGDMYQKDGHRVAAQPLGTAPDASAVAVPTDGAEATGYQELHPVRHELTFKPGTRLVSGGTMHLVDGEGKEFAYRIEPTGTRGYLAGLGYLHSTWGHGVWQGELKVEAESWVIDEVDPLAFDRQHCQQVIRVTEIGGEGRTGVGVLEQIIFGPHQRYGFKEILDGHPGE
ncbi:hypothetical protein [Yinghuangia seranimata]|uniref:hypothetical protein n=1 Tax=Yinghuangia seranimata TaxID=408067 RepID=UPI00248D2A86|nr:hypothetical protein [Yinghuangia seranimata]MDI2128579.1 hypothetical protein [Yinghuangia seranimata]